MSQRNWGARFAAFITGRPLGSALPLSYWDINRFLISITLSIAGLYFLVGAGLGVWSWYEETREANYEYHSRAAAEQKQAAEQIGDRCAVPLAPADFVGMCLADEIESYRKHNVADEDLQAQQEMARWTGVMGVTAAIGVPISICGLIAIWFSLRQTRQAISTDRDIGHAQVRAYLSIEPTMSGPKPAPGIVPTAAIRIKNTGQSPAYSVNYVAGLFVDNFPLPQRDGDLIGASDEDVPANLTISAGGHTDGEAEGNAPLKAEDVPKILNEGDRRLYLVCIVKYWDVFRERERTTKLCAYLAPWSREEIGIDGALGREYGFVLTERYNDAT